MICRVGIVVLATTALAAAANDPVAAIIDQARGAPAEIFADVVFHLLDGNRIAEKDRVPLLEEVFLRAEEARQTMPIRPAAIVPAPVNRAQLHLDALSIKCRAVQALLNLDGKRARGLFSQIAQPRVSKPDCKDSVLSDPTVYFETLGAVATRAPFTAEEQKKKVPLWMMADAVSGIGTSLEIIAAARNLSQIIHSEGEALAMLTAFATALGIDDSNRDFSAAAQNSNLVDAVFVANDRFTRLGALPQTMQAALRGYLARHLTASRCQDSADAGYSASLSMFNSSLAGQTAVLPISEDESKPANIEGTADKAAAPPEQKEFRDLARDVKALFAGSVLEVHDRVQVVTPGSSDLLADVPPGSPPPEVNDVLARLHAWRGSDGEDIIEVFRRKMGLYLTLWSMQSPILSKSPDSGMRQSILSSLIATLEDRAVLESSASDWLSAVRSLTDVRPFSSGSPDAAGARFPSSRDPQSAKGLVSKDVAQAITDSHLSALAVYGRLAMLERQLLCPLCQ